MPTVRPVIVCTKMKSVYFGYTDQDLATSPTIVLTKARNCVYWSKDMKGVLGLASRGPSSTCRISDPIPKIEINDSQVMLSMTDEAVTNWEKAPWG